MGQFDVDAAQRLAQQLLGDLGDRWRHTVGVGNRAAELSGTVAVAERDLLVAAGWLHDIGYAPSLQITGFHPLDGALHLERLGWPAHLVSMVAYHSGAQFVARALNLLGKLQRFPQEDSAAADALTYADQTTGPQGQRFTIEQRFAELLDRHGPESPSVVVHHLRAPYLLAVARRVERRIASLTAFRSVGK
jgi:HD superfamily phosphodiesterase